MRGWGHAETDEVFARKCGRGLCGWWWSTRRRTSRNGPRSGRSRRRSAVAETLRKWVRQAERDAGKRSGRTTEERERLKQLERENVELRRANEILRLASAYFAKAELDRRHK